LLEHIATIVISVRYSTEPSVLFVLFNVKCNAVANCSQYINSGCIKLGDTSNGSLQV